MQYDHLRITYPGQYLYTINNIGDSIPIIPKGPIGPFIQATIDIPSPEWKLAYDEWEKFFWCFLYVAILSASENRPDEDVLKGTGALYKSDFLSASEEGVLDNRHPICVGSLAYSFIQKAVGRLNQMGKPDFKNGAFWLLRVMDTGNPG